MVLKSFVLLTLTLLLRAVSATMLAGGKREQDGDEEGVVAAATFAVAELSSARETVTQGAPANEGEPRALLLHRVLHARTQVVSGINYFLSLEVRVRGLDGAEDGCMLHDVTVWSVPWQQKNTLTKQIAVRAGVQPCSPVDKEL